MARRASGSLVALLAVVLLASVAGCAPEQGMADDRVDTAEGALQHGIASLSTPATPLWTLDGTFVGSRAIIVDSVVLAYEVADDQLVLTAVDIDDGTPLWRRPASTGDTSTGTELSPVVVDDGNGNPLVALVAPPKHDPAADEYRHTVMLLDPQTGERRFGAHHLWAAAPEPCDAGSSVCLYGIAAHDDDWVHYRLDAATGRLKAAGMSVDGAVSERHLAEDVYAIRDVNGDEVITHVTSGERDWSKPVAEIVGEGKSVTSGIGRSFSVGKDDMIIIATAPPIDAEDGGILVRGQDFTTVGLNARTGEVVWSRSGGALCDTGAVCVGDSGYERAPGEDGFAFHSGATTLVGLDLMTGEETWSVPFDELSALEREADAGELGAPTGLILAREAGVPLVIEAESGEKRMLADDELAGCTFPGDTFDDNEFSNPNRDVVTFDGSRILRGCGVSGTTSDPEKFTEAVVRWGSSQWYPNGHFTDEQFSVYDEHDYVVQTAEGLVAYRF